MPRAGTDAESSCPPQRQRTRQGISTAEPGTPSGAVERAKTHGLSGYKRLQRLAQKTLMVHIFTGLGQTFRRAQFRRQKKVVHVERPDTRTPAPYARPTCFFAAAAPSMASSAWPPGETDSKTRWASSRAGQASVLTPAHHAVVGRILFRYAALWCTAGQPAARRVPVCRRRVCASRGGSTASAQCARPSSAAAKQAVSPCVHEPWRRIPAPKGRSTSRLHAPFK